MGKSKLEQYSTSFDEMLRETRTIALAEGDLMGLIEANKEMADFFPDTYELLVGPVCERNDRKKGQCYCNAPKALTEIYEEILSNRLPSAAIECTDCWETDLIRVEECFRETLPKTVWKDLCELREIYELFPKGE